MRSTACASTMRPLGDPNAPPALLISGLGGDHRGWRAVASRLDASFRVISFDNRDSGLSQRAQTPYAIRDMAEDAAGLLRELGVDSANVAGYSMGGAIAQELAIEFPRVVGRLALMATYDAGDPRVRPCSGALPLSGEACPTRST